MVPSALVARHVIRIVVTFPLRTAEAAPFGRPATAGSRARACQAAIAAISSAGSVVCRVTIVAAISFASSAARSLSSAAIVN